MDPSTTRITILMDNRAHLPDLETGWGFSALVERGDDALLFDTAWDGDQVLRNAARLGVDLSRVGAVFISHDHWDHMGGLARVLSALHQPRLWVPACISRHLKDDLALRGQVEPIQQARAIGPGLWSTGLLTGPPEEQSLLLQVPGGVAVLCGCGHPGLPDILRAAEQVGPVQAILGGFHGFHELDALEGLPRIVPAHCTVHLDAILTRYPDTARRGGAGLVLEW